MIIVHRRIHVKMASSSIAKLLQLSEKRQTGRYVHQDETLETSLQYQQGAFNVHTLGGPVPSPCLGALSSFFSLRLILFPTRPWKLLAARWLSQSFLAILPMWQLKLGRLKTWVRMKSTALSFSESLSNPFQPLIPHFTHLEKYLLPRCGTNGSNLITEFFPIQAKHSLA